MRKSIVLISCLLSLFLLTASTKTKKKPVSKTSKEITILKERISALEAQKVSLTAKVDILQRGLKKAEKDSDLRLIIAAGSGGLAVLLALIMIGGAIVRGAVKKESGNEAGKTPDREKHYEDMEYHVLNDWQNIWYHPENIDSKLYEDLKNHYPELHTEIEEWKEAVEKRQKLAEKMGRELAEMHSQVETMPYIFMLAYEEPNLFIEENEIKSGPYVCCHIKQGMQGTHDIMNVYYDSCLNLLAKKPYSEIKSLNGDVISLKNSIDLKIRKIKFTRELPGNCGFTAV
jgi:hypothetical protein